MGGWVGGWVGGWDVPKAVEATFEMQAVRK